MLTVCIERTVIAVVPTDVRTSVHAGAAVIRHVGQIRRRVQMSRQGQRIDVLILETLRHIPERMGFVEAYEEREGLGLVRRHSM